MYKLQKYNGISTKYTCPHCGRSRCFVRYVDEEGNSLAPNVGRCDHESSCGYHYTPKQFFADHPDQKPGRDWRYEPIVCHSAARSVIPSERSESSVSHYVIPSVASVSPLFTIPEDIVARSVRQNHDSHLITFLRTFLDPVVIEGLIDEYRIGVTKSHGTIFFQIDVQGRCRTGKIMLYNPEDGHRVKDPEVPGRITWVHSVMKQAGMLPEGWELSQCLFGEHLLAAYPEKPVALVESEKTALICAGLMPRYLWLATGGKSQLNPERLAVLAGRKVIAFPDVDAFEVWQEKLSSLSSRACREISGLSSRACREISSPQWDITVSPLLQQSATPEDFANHIDIADWLLRTCHPERSEGSHVLPSGVEESPSSKCRPFLLASRFLNPENADAVEALIGELDLEFMGAEKLREDTPGHAPQ